MAETQAPLRNISDTACWAALYRARETERPDALFKDPFARRLAGQRGEAIAATMPFSDKNSWSWMARTYLFDHFITDQIRKGADMVINLAAGLDARPYRMSLPSSLQWIEIDLPEILAYKEEILRPEKPTCALERIALDLADVSVRRAIFDQLSQRAKNALILSEGFIIYLSRDEVAALAQDLAAAPSFKSWVIDLTSPGLLALLQKHMQKQLSEGGSPLQFGPPEGPHFFEAFGWEPAEVRALLKTAAKLKRLTFVMRLLAMLPASNGAQGNRPWGGVCLLQRH